MSEGKQTGINCLASLNWARKPEAQFKRNRRDFKEVLNTILPNRNGNGRTDYFFFFLFNN